MEVINMQQDEEREGVETLGLEQCERVVVSTMTSKLYVVLQLLQLYTLFTEQYNSICQISSVNREEKRKKTFTCCGEL
jgi:hypothetical protein